MIMDPPATLPKARQQPPASASNATLKGGANGSSSAPTTTSEGLSHTKQIAISPSMYPYPSLDLGVSHPLDAGTRGARSSDTLELSQRGSSLNILASLGATPRFPSRLGPLSSSSVNSGPVSMTRSPRNPDSFFIPHESPSDLNLAHGRLFPIVPEFFQRYDRAVFVEPQDSQLTIKALTLDYQVHADPPGWISILHPEGVLYFYSEQKKTVTDANLFNPIYHNQIMEDIATIEEFVHANNIQLPPKYTLAMELNMQQDNLISTDYYFADHERKIIFFLDDIDAGANIPVWVELKGTTSLAHARHEIEAQYWFHGMLYPSTVELTAERIAYLRGCILHLIGDVTTSNYSTSPYPLSDLHRLLKQVNSLSKDMEYETVGASSFLCRLMLVFSRNRFYNRAGVPEARLSRNKSVHRTKEEKSTLVIRILSPLLFSMPRVCLSNIGAVWVDGIMSHHAWNQLRDQLLSEWQNFILLATVLLNANVAFLATQSIDIGTSHYRSPIQIASYLSTSTSLGSIVAGLLLQGWSGQDVVRFLRETPTFGPEIWAILASLPYALLLYAMVSFVVAFALNCFQDSNIAAMTLVAFVWLLLITLLVLCIWAQYSGQRGLPMAGDANIEKSWIGRFRTVWLLSRFLRRRSVVHGTTSTSV